MQLYRLCFIAGALSLMAGIAHADVSWEHTYTMRLTKFKKPLAKLKMYTNWTSQRNRMLLKYDLSGLTQMNSMESGEMLPGGRPPFPFAKFGSAALVQRLDDDHVVGYLSQTKSYINEEMKPLAKRLRFDPWKKLAPKLSQQAPPEFTTEQRKRLGAEIRGVTEPLSKRVYKVYFRRLPNTRTFDGIEAQGYRVTQLINAGGISPQSQQWMRVNMELWMARDLPGDEAIRDFLKASTDPSRRAMWKSASMWLNEIWPVAWYSMPEEMIEMYETLIPPPGSPRAGFGGTPVRIYYSTIFPPLQRASVGEMRQELALTRRDTTTLANTVFDAPQGYKHEKLDPFLKQYEELMQGKVPGMSTFAQFNESLGFSWQAWKEYVAAVRKHHPLLD